MAANDRQVGGDHYQSPIQHWDLITENLGPVYLIGCATKYVARNRFKNGKQDLEKALHFVEKLLESHWCSHEEDSNWQMPGYIHHVDVMYYCQGADLNRQETKIIGCLTSGDSGEWVDARDELKGLLEGEE